MPPLCGASAFHCVRRPDKVVIAYARGEMTNYMKLPTWADIDHVHAVVETPRGSRAKLEFDPKLGAFTLAKPLLAGLTYPYDSR